MSLISVTDAKRNLRHMKRQNPNVLEIDDTDDSQIQTYIALRKTNSKVFPEKFMEAWKKRRVDAKLGLKITRKVWLVPKANFPMGLPPAIQDDVVSADQIQLMDTMTGHPLDCENCYIIDRRQPIEGLGKSVNEAEYYVDSHSFYKDRSPSAK